jgi:simple sugar transport system permease protein
MVLAAILFGTLQQAGLAINAHVPKEAMDVLTAAAIIIVAIANRLARRRALESPPPASTLSPPEAPQAEEQPGHAKGVAS